MLDKSKAEEVFDEEYIREKARIAYRSDLEKAKTERKNKWHPATIAGIAGLVIFYISESFGFQYASYALIGLGIIAVIYFMTSNVNH